MVGKMEKEELKNENNLLPYVESGEQNLLPKAQDNSDENKYVVSGSRINQFGIRLKEFVYETVPRFLHEKILKKDFDYEEKLGIIHENIKIIRKIDEELKITEEKIQAGKTSIEENERHLKKIERISSGLLAKIFPNKKIKEKKEKLKKEIEEARENTDNLEREISIIKSRKEQPLRILAENVESLSKAYEDETSIRTNLKKYLFGGILSLITGILFASALFYGLAYMPFEALLIGKNDKTDDVDSVAVIAADDNYTDILIEALKFSDAKKLPIMLSGNESSIEGMEKMFALWKYPAEKVFRAASPATDLNANVEQSYKALNKKGYKTPVVFTSSVKIPRIRCEFNRYGMKDARFINILKPLDYNMDLESGKKFMQDATTRSPYSTGKVFTELIMYIAAPHCWMPHGSGRK